MHARKHVQGPMIEGIASGLGLLRSVPKKFIHPTNICLVVACPPPHPPSPIPHPPSPPLPLRGMARGMVYSQVLLLMTLREKHVAVKKPCERGGNGLGVGFGPCRKRCLTGFPLKLGCGSWVVL